MDIFIEEGNNFEDLEAETNDNGTNEGQSVVENSDKINILDMDVDDETSLIDQLAVKVKDEEVNGQTMQHNLPTQSSMNALPLKDKSNSVTHIIDPSPEVIIGPSETTRSKSSEKKIAISSPIDSPNSPSEVVIKSTKKQVPKTENVVECNEKKPDGSSSVAKPVPRPSSKPKAKLETDYVSSDPKENQDNFDARWEALRSLSRDQDKYSLIRKRWGNTNRPDPSIDLTYRHRNRLKSISNQERGREKMRSSRKPINQRSLSCVSHLKKLMDDVRNNYYSEYKELCKKYDLQLYKLCRDHQTEVVRLVQMPLQNFDNMISNFGYILDRQKQDKENVNEQFFRGVQELLTRTSSHLARYQKDSDEIMVFHKQYVKDGSNSLTDEQCLLLRETERMYDEYNKFYG